MSVITILYDPSSFIGLGSPRQILAVLRLHVQALKINQYK